MTTDADELREQIAAAWERASAGWDRQQGQLRRWTAPVSQWLVEAINPQPGFRVLELAAGPGETGFLAAELIKPGGTLVSTDQSEGMLDVGRARAAELGLDNVEFKRIDAEWIDADVASFDGVLCRFGYMLMPDPQAALRETRRVLRPGGRVALAVWDRPDVNPWATVTPMQLVGRGALPAPDPDGPGMFALADREKLADLLGEAGFGDVEIDAVDVEQRHENLDAFWARQLDCAPPLAPALEKLDEATIDEIKQAVAAAYEPFTSADGELTLPGRTVVAVATA